MAVTTTKVLSPAEVKWLQVEATTKCNAWCPGCGRNKGGYGLADNLVVTDLDTNRYQQILNEFPNLETVDFCGTYGDAIAAANIIELTELTGQPFALQPWFLDKKMNKYEKVRTTVPISNCQHPAQRSYYVNANGQLSNCCFINTSLSADCITQLPDIATELDAIPRDACLYYCGK